MTDTITPEATTSPEPTTSPAGEIGDAIALLRVKWIRPEEGYPQTLATPEALAAVPCGTTVTLQIDDYAYGTPQEIADTDKVLADGILTQGEDSHIYVGPGVGTPESRETYTAPPCETAPPTEEPPVATPEPPATTTTAIAEATPPAQQLAETGSGDYTGALVAVAVLFAAGYRLVRGRWA